MSGTTIQGDIFCELVDQVLIGVGRQSLGTTYKQIITVGPGDRVLQILAGAGSGKTEMLVWRVLYELMVLGTDASRVIVTTFTRKAATELAIRTVERSDALLERARKRGLDLADPHVHDLRIGTLHSLCDALLAEFDAEYMSAGTEVIDEIETRVRLARDYRLIFTQDQSSVMNLIDRLLAREELVALFRPPWDAGSWPRNTVQKMDFIQMILGQHTETWLPRCGPTHTPNGIETKCPGVTNDLVELQQRWEQYLDDNNILDFATIQHRFHLRQGDILGHVDHVFVDEFQDMNPIQLSIHLGWLSREETRLTVVGDDDQALYRFRGSDITCFTGLETNCLNANISYRREKLEHNWRSTKSIIGFAGAFRKATVLSKLSMKKKIRAPKTAPLGDPPRLLEGSWTSLCDHIASEIDALGAGRIPDGRLIAPSVAILLFSTSEKEGRRGGTAALDMRRAFERKGLRVYNPRNKAAARKGSPFYSLTALLSYLIDPVICAPAGNGGRDIMVWASCNDPTMAAFAPVEPPSFNVTPAHAKIQKAYRGSTQGIKRPDPAVEPLLAYLDQIRSDLVIATMAHQEGAGLAPRLTLSGVVARLLAFPQFRGVGFSPALFREALFTQFLEANIAPTRRTRFSLDQPLAPTCNSAGKVSWPDEIWNFLGLFGALISETDLDDVEDDSFADDAISLLTFHQAKGLEFDHVYVGLTGRQPAPHSVLRTKLFSGERPIYYVADGQARSGESAVLRHALADYEREIYVALTRAKQRLTIIHDPNDQRPMCGLNHALEALYEGLPVYPLIGGIAERRWQS